MRLWMIVLALWATPAGAQGLRCGEPLDGLNFEVRCTSGLEIAVVNAGVTGALALLRGAITGRVRSLSDAAEVGGAGVAAGLGFALAKHEVGAGRTPVGLALAVAAGSAVENVVEGDHPLARVRLGVAVGDVRLRTPLARRPGPHLAVEIDPLALASVVVLPASGYTPDLSGGALTWRAPGGLGTGHGGNVAGLTLGRVVVVSAVADDGTRRHELVHALQSRQSGAVGPYGTLGALRSRWRRTSAGGRVSWDVRTGIPSATLGALDRALLGYGASLAETEAYTLGRD